MEICATGEFQSEPTSDVKNDYVSSSSEDKEVNTKSAFKEISDLQELQAVPLIKKLPDTYKELFVKSKSDGDLRSDDNADTKEDPDVSPRPGAARLSDEVKMTEKTDEPYTLTQRTSAAGSLDETQQQRNQANARNLIFFHVTGPM